MSSGSSRRAVQALETRRLIVDAARRLFTERGYGATSIGEIAKGAGVAVATVYASAGTKPTLLRLLLDRIDEEAGIAELAAQVARSTEARQILALEVRITRQLAERCGDVIAALQSAAGVEPDLAATFAAGMARHRAGAEATIERLLGVGGLRADLERDHATAILATLTTPGVYASLTGEYGWSFDQAQAWLEQTLAKQLFSPNAEGRHHRLGKTDARRAQARRVRPTQKE